MVKIWLTLDGLLICTLISDFYALLLASSNIPFTMINCFPQDGGSIHVRTTFKTLTKELDIYSYRYSGVK